VLIGKDDAQTPICAGQWHTDVVTDAAFSPDGRWLATSSEDGSATLVALKDSGCGTPIKLEPQAGILYSVAFAPDSKALVTAAFDSAAQVWTLDGSPIAELAGHRDRIYTASFSPDGRWILTEGVSGKVRIEVK
jgi:WD40 repeat protein